MGELKYSQFAGSMTTLHKVRFAEIQANPELKAQFDASTPEERLNMFDAGFKTAVEKLFSAFETYQNSTRNLAIAIFNVVEASGSTLAEASKIMEGALNKGLSTGYMSKLYQVGKLLKSKPELVAVTDIAKLHEIARIPESRRDAALETLNVASATRDQVTEMVQRELGAEVKPGIATQSEKAKLVNAVRNLEKIFNDFIDNENISEPTFSEFNDNTEFLRNIAKAHAEASKRLAVLDIAAKQAKSATKAS